jgi:branched-subunit amino acid aminotransferase/4-amino-4-deoxychorismate lyase
MSVTGDFFQFTGGELNPVDHAIPTSLSVADSWLVSSGSTRVIERHLARFAGSVTKVQQQDLTGFFDAVVSAIPTEGDWFPRIEFRKDQTVGQQLFFRLRQAPARTLTCSLWSLDEPDPRVDPQIKGPDLSVCQRLRRKANLHGADEAVILDTHGNIADGALSAIVWWRNDVLCAPDDSTDWLPSITRELVFEMANQAGFETAMTNSTPQDLAGCEIWSLSALQGIRGVTNWQNIPVADLKRLNSFRKRLALLTNSAQNDDLSIA